MKLRAMLLMVLVGLIPAISSAENLGPNLVTNGSFEMGDATLDAWRWGCSDDEKQTLAIDDSVAHSGKRSVRLHSEGVLVSIVNLWGKPKAVRLSVGGRPVKQIHDMRGDRVLAGDRLALKPLDAMLLRVK